MSGIFLINKEKGMTSFDVIYHLRKKFNIKKIGHTGTLDPFATGLLIVCFNKATKLSFLFENLDKAYEGRIIFDYLYDTYDVTGKIVDEKKTIITQDQLTQGISKYHQTSYEQIPPMYSAIKINGQKMYELARKGINLDLPGRLVEIKEFKALTPLSNNEFDFYAHVSKGTYIRSLAYDLGVSLNTYGALKTLNRTQIGDFSIKDAKTIAEIQLSDLITDVQIFKHYPKVVLNDYLIKLVKNGVYLDQRQTSLSERFVVTDEKDTFIAVYEPTENQAYKPIYFF